LTKRDPVADYVDIGLLLAAFFDLIGFILFVLYPVRSIIHLNYDILEMLPMAALPALLVLGIGGAKYASFHTSSSLDPDVGLERFGVYAFVGFIVFCFLSLLTPWRWF